MCKGTCLLFVGIILFGIYFASTWLWLYPVSATITSATRETTNYYRMDKLSLTYHVNGNDYNCKHDIYGDRDTGRCSRSVGSTCMVFVSLASPDHCRIEADHQDLLQVVMFHLVFGLFLGVSSVVTMVSGIHQMCSGGCMCRKASDKGVTPRITSIEIQPTPNAPGPGVEGGEGGEGDDDDDDGDVTDFGDPDDSDDIDDDTPTEPARQVQVVVQETTMPEPIVFPCGHPNCSLCQNQVQNPVPVHG